MSVPSVPLDTSAEVFELLVECWRGMTVAERVELVSQMNADVELLAVSGIAAQRPGLSDVQIRHELARRRFGDLIADRAYRNLLV